MKASFQIPLLRVFTLAALLLAPCSIPRALAQGGSLTPPGAPAPTMRSLQEIWDKIGVLEAQNTAQQAQITVLQNQGPRMHYASGGSLPWVISTVDSADWVGEHTSLAFTPGGQPAISYLDATNRNLKYAVFNGSSWAATIVDGSLSIVGDFTSLAFTPSGQPAISYYDVTNTALKYAVFNGSSWTLTTVDGAGDVGYETSLAFGPDGQPAIAYYDVTNSALKFARFNGSTWNVITVYDYLDVGRYSTLAFGPDGQPAISFFEASGGGNLMFTRSTGSNWPIVFPITVIPIDALGNVGSHTSLAFGPDGQPAISYYDQTSGNLKFVRYSVGPGWTFSTVDDGGVSDDVGQYTSLAFGPDGQPVISYYDVTNGDLKFARYNGYNFNVFVVDSTGDVGSHTSLAFGPDGLPAISYFDTTNLNLKFARMGTFPSSQ